MKRLTDSAFWEENWRKGFRPRRLWLYRDFDFETIRLLHGRNGPKGARVLEVGAGGSRVLPYLRKRFGFDIFGSDFSIGGCLLLRANMALSGVDGSVVCEDLFQSSLPSESFDLVFSAGLIEHFDDPRAVIAEHLRLLKPGGRLVLITPNLQGVHGKIVRGLAPPLWSLHRVLGPKDLASVLQSLEVDRIRSGYLGSFLIHIGRGPEWTGVRGWPGLVQLLVCGSVKVINGLISLFFRLSPWRPHSRAWSPGCFAEGYKRSGSHSALGSAPSREISKSRQ
ncbi:MAG TPA: class I SAM-dependent methyltransferase [Terriglobia bacterium]|nr:class I SAM-dependent methyltransferase [Terriglobia bacterium]